MINSLSTGNVPKRNQILVGIVAADAKALGHQQPQPWFSV